MPQDINIRPTIVLDQSFSYTPENVANKSTDGTLASNSDTLYPSQKAVKTYADGKVVQTITNGVTTSAPSQDAVFDALALKQNTLVSGTSIKTVDGNSLLGSGDLSTDKQGYEILGMNGLGSILRAQTLGVPFQTANTAITLVAQTQIGSAVYLPFDTTINGIYFWTRVQGQFVGNNENSLAIYSINGISGDITRVAITANDQNIFKGVANTRQAVNLTAPVALTKGTYIVQALWNASSTTISPQIAGGTPLNSANMAQLDSIKAYVSRSAQAAQATTITQAQMNTSTSMPWFGLY